MGKRLVPKQVRLTQEQDEQLRLWAAEEGRAQSSLVRECLASALASREWAAAHVARNAELRRTRGWCRDDIYEERLSRCSPQK